MPRTADEKRATRSIMLDLALIVLATQIVVSLNGFWSYTMSPVLDGDNGLHFEGAATLYYFLTTSNNPLYSAFLILSCPFFYPPGMYLVTAGCWCCTTPSVSSCLLSLTLFLPLLVAGCYMLSRPLGGRVAGLATIAFCCSVPNLAIFTRRYLIDFASVGATVFALGLLANVDGFRQRRITLCAGLAFGVAMLAKFTACWFILPALAVLVLSELREWRGQWLLLSKNLLIGAAAPFACLKFAQRLAAEIPLPIEGWPLVTVQRVCIVVAVVGSALLWFALSAWLKRRALRRRVNLEHHENQQTPADLAQEQRRDEACHSITNLGQSLALAFLSCGPWFLSNTSTVLARSSPLQGEIPQHLTDLCSPILWLELPELYSHPAAAILALVGALLSLTPFYTKVDRAIAASWLVGLLITLVILGPADRYMYLPFALSAFSLVHVARKIPGAYWVMLIIGCVLSYSALCLSLPKWRDTPHSVIPALQPFDHYLGVTLYPQENRDELEPESKFTYEALEIAPLLPQRQTTPGGHVPLILALTDSDSHKLLDSMSVFFTTVSCWNDCSNITCYYDWDSQKLLQFRPQTILTQIEQLRRLAPQQLGELEMKKLYRTTPRMEAGSETRIARHTWDAIVSLSSPRSHKLSDAEASELLVPGKFKKSLRKIDGSKVVITLWLPTNAPNKQKRAGQKRSPKRAAH